VLLEF